MMRVLSLLFGLFLLVDAAADSAVDLQPAAYAAAVEAYEAGNYEQAARAFEQVLAADPECARCAHLLGRSYGRLAEQAGWLRAISLARKTCDALEQAVALDPDDPRAVEDLIEYYRAAPGFLGGSVEKAAELERRLHGGGSDHTS